MSEQDRVALSRPLLDCGKKEVSSTRWPMADTSLLHTPRRPSLRFTRFPKSPPQNVWDETAYELADEHSAGNVGEREISTNLTDVPLPQSKLKSVRSRDNLENGFPRDIHTTHLRQDSSFRKEGNDDREPTSDMTLSPLMVENEGEYENEDFDVIEPPQKEESPKDLIAPELRILKSEWNDIKLRFFEQVPAKVFPELFDDILARKEETSITSPRPANRYMPPFENQDVRTKTLYSSLSLSSTIPTACIEPKDAPGHGTSLPQLSISSIKTTCSMEPTQSGPSPNTDRDTCKENADPVRGQYLPSIVASDAVMLIFSFVLLGALTVVTEQTQVIPREILAWRMLIGLVIGMISTGSLLMRTTQYGHLR